MTALRQRQPREENAQHLKDIRDLPCLVCASDAGCDPAHVRFSCSAEGKFNPGVGAKPDDCYVVPLCRRHHEEQHRMGEVAFWLKKGIRPLQIARQLWAARGNFEEMWAIVREFHRVHETMDDLPF